MNVFLDTLGCRLNQAEIERMAAQFRQAGHTMVATAAEAELVVINTCAVTMAASSDSRQVIRQAQRAGQARIVVTGCYATLDPKTIGEIPGVDFVFSNAEKENLVHQVLGLPDNNFSSTNIPRQPLPGEHQRTRAFIKAQDGCDNFCTFCITRVVRGPGKSMGEKEILTDILAAVAGGVKEVVLTGVHLGSWGQDLQPPRRLYDLIKTILHETPINRLRLSSLEPWDLDDNFFTLWQDRRLCRHLHLPLQSGAAETLKRMARKTTPETFTRLIDQARHVSPDIAITTDVMVGFPGESEVEFSESLAFVEDRQFAAGHVFAFSARPGTPAARYSNQVEHSISKKRSAAMRTVLESSRQKYYQKFIGRQLQVLWESCRRTPDGQFEVEGLSDNYLRIRATSYTPLWNEISQVALEEIENQIILGKIIA